MTMVAILQSCSSLVASTDPILTQTPGTVKQKSLIQSEAPKYVRHSPEVRVLGLSSRVKGLGPPVRGSGITSTCLPRHRQLPSATPRCVRMSQSSHACILGKAAPFPIQPSAKQGINGKGQGKEQRMLPLCLDLLLFPSFPKSPPHSSLQIRLVVSMEFKHAQRQHQARQDVVTTSWRSRSMCLVIELQTFHHSFCEE